MRYIFYLFLIFSLSSCFQLPKMGTQSDAEGSSSLPSTDSSVEKVEVSQKGSLTHRLYLRQLLKEIFNSVTYTNNVDNILNSALSLPATYGMSCDIYSSSSDVECGGDISTGSSSPVLLEASAVRQVSKLKLCEDVLNQANSVKAAAEKISELTSGNPNEISISALTKMHSLFFRGRAIKQSELDAYISFNSSLKLRPQGNSISDRWKSILVMMCESPEWEIL